MAPPGNAIRGVIVCAEDARFDGLLRESWGRHAAPNEG